MDFTGRIEDISIDYETNKPIIRLVLNERENALNCYDKLKEEEKLSIKIDKYRKKRSNDANAYFHVLINKLARAYNRTDEEMKIIMNLSYGTIARDKDGKFMAAKIPKNTDIKSFYPYCKKYKEQDNCDCYLFYKRTSQLNTLEFSQLLNGVVQECKDIGIPTLDDLELKSLIDSYCVSNSK